MSNLGQMPPDFVKTFIRHINMQRFIGLDIFYEKNMPFIRKYKKFCIFNILFIPMVMGQVMYIILGSNTGAKFLDVVNAVPTTFMALQDAVKMIVVFCKRNEIRCVIIGIADIWPTLMLSDRKKKTIKKWFSRLKTLDDAFFRCSLAFLSIYEMAPFFITVHGFYTDPGNVQYLYPLQSYFTHSLNAYWLYVIGYFYLLMTSVVSHMVLYISTDFLLVTLTFDLSTLLDLLQMDLQDAVQNYDRDVEESIRDVKEIVTRHQKLLWLADQLSTIFGLIVFVQISFSSIVICCFGFLTVIAEGMLVNNLLAALGVVAAIWNLCWPGQLLVDTSFSVSEAAYRSEWYNKNAEFRKYIVIIMSRLVVIIIVIIMSRAQKPCYLTALGFSNLTLANFSKILSTSWSYLSVLNQMYQSFETELLDE